MPIYEFFCPDCNALYSFFTVRLAPERRPDCPRCSRPRLERRPSSFATLKHRGDDEPDPLEALDDSKLEGAMETLMQEMGSADEEDPRAMGRMMRRFGELSGLEMGGRMEELMRRMEAGEDPDSLEGDLGDGLDGDESLDDFFKLKKALGERRSKRPRVDDELYFL
ncbi:MAG: FmdB family zinc ribbon protein [Thermoanaerobaculia bacterium]